MSKKTKEAVDSDKKSIDMMNLNELREIKSEELQKIALDLKIDDIGRMTRQEITYAILKSQYESKGEIYAEGVLEILNSGHLIYDPWIWLKVTYMASTASNRKSAKNQ